MKYCSLIITFLALSLLPLHADIGSGTSAKDLGAVDMQTLKLYQLLLGSTWGYVWRNSTVDISFGQDGVFMKSPWGPGATWRIVNANTIAIKHPKVGEMAIHFTPDFKKFTCKDFSGDKARGFFRDPNAKVTQ